MIRGKTTLHNIWFKSEERVKVTKIVKHLLSVGYNFTEGEMDVKDNLVYGTPSGYYLGHEEIQLEVSTGHKTK